MGVKKNVPPYLDPSLTIEDLMTGVSFASAGAGFDPLTSQIGVILLKLYLRLLYARVFIIDICMYVFCCLCINVLRSA